PDVTIDFNHKLIVCSCPQDGMCRHKVSVILSLYQYLDSVQDWAANWREKKNVSLHVLAGERSPVSWQAMVDEVMSHLLRGDARLDSYLISTMADNALTKLRK